MSKLVDIEVIRKEIERLKGNLPRGACASQLSALCYHKDEAYDEILSFLDTLPEEKSVDLEEEIGKYCEPIEAWQVQAELLHHSKNVQNTSTNLVEKVK